MKMSFMNFEFPSNPHKIEVKSSADIKTHSVFDSSCVVENLSLNPSVVTGEGVFYGEKGEEYCLYLIHLLKLRESGALLLPSAVGMNAYLSKFDYKKSCNKNEIAYSFEFVEECSDKKEMRLLRFAIAEEGENAFEIANRCGVAVDDIMRLNDIATPFSINSGDRVVLYGN